MAVIIGVISDTHGLLRPEALDALAGSERIIHAGDVGSPQVLDRLGEIAPVDAVRGNMDRGDWAERLPLALRVRVEDVLIHVLHDLSHLTPDQLEEVGVVVSGHSHRPRNAVDGGVLYLNPGSAGPRRFRLPVSVARLHIDGGSVRAELIEMKFGD